MPKRVTALLEITASLRVQEMIYGERVHLGLVLKDE